MKVENGRMTQEAMNKKAKVDEQDHKLHNINEKIVEL